MGFDVCGEFTASVNGDEFAKHVVASDVDAFIGRRRLHSFAVFGSCADGAISLEAIMVADFGVAGDEAIGADVVSFT